jgi:hypothetical protein
VLLISNNAGTWSGPPDFGRRKHLDRGELGAKSRCQRPLESVEDEFEAFAVSTSVPAGTREDAI